MTNLIALARRKRRQGTGGQCKGAAKTAESTGMAEKYEDSLLRS